MAQTARKKRKRKKKNAHKPMAVVLLLFLLILFGMLGIYQIIKNSFHEEEVLPSPTISVPPTLPPSSLLAECFGSENGYTSYTENGVSAALGIDVSSHQGWIDWNAVAESDIDYVILRAGYRGYGNGSVHPDEYFEYNIAAATATDLGVGIYFFSQALTPEEAADEAQIVLDMIQSYDIDYPIFFDWEPIAEDGARTATISATELTACAKSFCQVIEDAGYRAGIYFNLSMASNYYHLYELKDYAFWLAEYGDTPSFPFAFDMWQYTSDGTVPGIATNVDINLSFTAYGG